MFPRTATKGKIVHWTMNVDFPKKKPFLCHWMGSFKIGVKLTNRCDRLIVEYHLADVGNRWKHPRLSRCLRTANVTLLNGLFNGKVQKPYSQSVNHNFNLLLFWQLPTVSPSQSERSVRTKKKLWTKGTLFSGSIGVGKRQIAKHVNISDPNNTTERM